MESEQSKSKSPHANEEEKKNNRQLNALLLFDLEAYISRYDENSETTIARLLFVARRAPSADLATSAFKLLEQKLKDNGNWKRYKEVFGNCPICPDEAVEDTNTGMDNDSNALDVVCANGERNDR